MEYDFLDNLMDADMNLLEWRNSQPYDGVLGQLEDWVPKAIKTEFTHIRNKLLDAMNYKELVKVKKIRQWIDECYKKQKIQGDEIYRPSIPPKFLRDISYLALIQNANSLDETEGLRMLAKYEATIGATYSNEQSKRAKVPRKLTETFKRNIRNKYIKAQNEDGVYGVVKALAGTYDVSERQIHNIVKDLIKK
ncbi:hypothetical protein [Methylotenera sp.]|uniref:hypothetical protein n=1 Tax=Methylotenera sp. TaxID=2051956 RepID=UPI00271BA875|nr:hypothetical protein [Methylotenera sp.]MDO9152092.1 hypothetical protein [Methylotenera sp.]MDP2230318.1 hypothetical protein [Methylotenera sp.]MDP3142305.1 hypothetical protein [Methylotenera sp.]